MGNKTDKTYDFYTKKDIGPAAFLNPVPLIMCSLGDMDHSNIITIAWCGTVNSDPPMLSVSIRKNRFSHGIISDAGKVCVNLVSDNIVEAADLCGVKSGRDIDKFKSTGLTKVRSPLYSLPMIGESPVSMECSVKQIIELGSHDLFILSTDAVYVAESLFDEKGTVDLRKAHLTAYSHGEYYTLGSIIGFFGYSVAGKDAIGRRKRK